MTIYNRSLLVAALVAICSFGCEDKFLTDIDVDLSDVPLELIVEGIIFPGDTARIVLDKTRRVDEPMGVTRVRQAEVRVHVRGGRSFTFTERAVPAGSNFDPFRNPQAPDTLSVYEAVLPADAFAVGDVVTLEVITLDGIYVTAQQTILPPSTIEDVLLRDRDFALGRFTTTVRAGAEGAGVLITGQYIHSVTEFDSQGEPIAVDTQAVSLNFETGDDLDYFYYGDKYLILPSSFGESTTLQTFNVYSNSSIVRNSDEYQAVRFSTLTLDAVSIAYFRALQLSDFNTDNPFVEPVVVPTNIDGGRGIFVATSAPTSIDFELEQ